jgi:hypothetical protein
MADGFKPIARCAKGGASLVQANYANQLIDLLNALGGGRVAPISNVGKMMSGGQFILDLSLLDARLRAIEGAAGGGAANTTSGYLPFGINDTSANANIATVNVRFGTIGNNVPTGVGTDFTLSIPNSNTTFYANITIDNNATVTGVTINTGSVPTPNTSTKAYSLIGNVQVVNNIVTVIDQSLLFSQTFVACNRNTSDPTTTPGSYFLQVS